MNANHLGGALLQRARACKCHCAPPKPKLTGIFKWSRVPVQSLPPWPGPLPDSPPLPRLHALQQLCWWTQIIVLVILPSISMGSGLQTWRCRPQGQQQKISQHLIEKCSHHINLFVTLEPTRRALTKSENKRWLQYRSIKQRSTIPAASPSVFLQNIYWYSTTLIFFSSFFIHVIQPTGSS